MKKLLTGTVLAAVCLACSGCIVVATVAAVGAVVIANSSSDKNANKGPRPAAEASRQAPEAPIQPVPAVMAAPAASAAPVVPATPGELSAQSAAGLAQPGKVVVVNIDAGTRTTLPWQDGMTLAAATATGKADSPRSARIFRDTRVLPVDLRQDWTGALALFAGDVVELRR